jgi:hypothetical protein
LLASFLVAIEAKFKGVAGATAEDAQPTAQVKDAKGTANSQQPTADTIVPDTIDDWEVR